jgi:hypothetical protein
MSIEACSDGVRRYSADHPEIEKSCGGRGALECRHCRFVQDGLISQRAIGRNIRDGQLAIDSVDCAHDDD